MIASEPLRAQAQALVTHPPELAAVATDQSIATLLSEVNALAIRLTQRTDLPKAEHWVLDIINRSGPLTVPQIARQRSTSRQNIQILVDRLEMDGRVALQGNPAHKRSALVCLTEEGSKWLRNQESLEKNLFRDIGRQMNELETRQAISALCKVRGLLSAPVHDCPEQRERRQSPKELKRSSSLVSEPDEAPDQEFPINLL